MHSPIPARSVGSTSGPTVIFSGGGTGGHLYPALALAEALQRRRPSVHPIFVGAERGIEARVLPARGVEHVLVPVEGFRRGKVLANVRVLRALARSLARVARLMHEARPALVVVTGGYAGGPAGLVALLLRIRLAVQEQNARPGLTVRTLARWADRVFVAFPEARDRLPRRARTRTLVAGNPVRPPNAWDRSEAADCFGLDPDLPVVLVVGGSQGSRALNRALADLVRGIADGRLEPLVAGGRPVQILWSTGPDHHDEALQAVRAAGAPGWLRTTGYIDEMNAALSLATLAVSRAGAMATSEFLAWEVPAVLVPLPTAAADHQTLNARALEESGAARVVPEKDLDGVRLHAVLRDLLASVPELQAMARAARERADPDAADTMAAELDRLIGPAHAGARA